MDKAAMYKLTYGLFVLTAKEGEKENGCIIFEITISENPGKNQIYNLEFMIPQKKGGS